jgi:hypothetical protein
VSIFLLKASRKVKYSLRLTGIPDLRKLSKKLMNIFTESYGVLLECRLARLNQMLWNNQLHKRQRLKLTLFFFFFAVLAPIRAPINAAIRYISFPKNL